MIWNPRNIRGTRDEVKAAIAADKTLPQSVKDFIASQVDGLPPAVRAATLDAFCQDVENKDGITVTRNIGITLVGFRI